MNGKNLRPLAVAVNRLYGWWFFPAPQGAAGLYGYGAVTTSIGNLCQ